MYTSHGKFLDPVELMLFYRSSLDELLFFDYIYRMAIRGEVFSTKVLLAKRTYFFNVKENRLGDLYLNIVESKKDDEGQFERQSLIVFDEDKAAFLKGLDDALRVLSRESANKRGPAPRKAAAKNGGARKAYSKKRRGNDAD
ncbi:MAG: PUR family DNA/RNA-binding protein [Spirochaetaceae bacterium]|nr:PUR family DNA/RNA-binding protein [Spirochaetaceae bacterium]